FQKLQSLRVREPEFLGHLRKLRRDDHRALDGFRHVFAAEQIVEAGAQRVRNLEEIRGAHLALVALHVTQKSLAEPGLLRKLILRKPLPIPEFSDSLA